MSVGLILTTRDIDRFWGQVAFRQWGCWEWRGALAKKGYAHFWLVNSPRIGHRISYQITRGPIPDGLTIAHLCRNKKCVNPSHLEVATIRKSVLRGFGVTAMNARKRYCLRGHPLFGPNLYTYPNGGRSCRTCKKASMQKFLNKWRLPLCPTQT